MLIFLNSKSQTTEKVTRFFEYLQQEIIKEVYKSLLQVILADNGHKFYNVLNIELVNKFLKYFFIFQVYHGKKAK